jgi:hypothetical protein
LGDPHEYQQVFQLQRDKLKAEMPRQELFSSTNRERGKDEIESCISTPESEANDFDKGAVGAGLVWRKVPRHRSAEKPARLITLASRQIGP